VASEAATIVSIVGTRPEAIKMAPVVRALAQCPWCRQRVLLTGQHAGLAGHFSFVPAGGVEDLGVDPAWLSAGEIREAIRDRLCGWLARERPDMVLVHGDTSSAAAGAFAACDCGLPVAHVEAGLRSGDRQQPWPEEDHRIAIDALADLLFAPTATAAANLRAERAPGAVHITGNTGIDALFHVRDRLGGSIAPDGPRKTLLVTCHRRENRGAKLRQVTQALKRLVATLPVDILFALHSNPQVRAPIEHLLAGDRRIALLDPLGYEEMVALMLRSWLILTDSGGLQEEGAALGLPVLVLRDSTERIEAPDNIALIGTESARIVAAVRRLATHPHAYARMARPSLAFGDGCAAERIAAILEDWLARRPAARPDAAAPKIRADLP
jgi:UDP-N-acetylglucosamine 2-epimerase (non-hydrolysing)